MAEQSESKAHLWIFFGLVLLALAVIFAGIMVFKSGKFRPYYRQTFKSRWPPLRAKYDDDIVMIQKHPPLEVWYKFANAVRRNDLEAAMAATCEGPTVNRPEPKKYDLKSLPVDDLLEIVIDFDNVHEVILLRCGFVPEFGSVLEKASEHYIIEANWKLDSINKLDKQADTRKRGQITKTLERTKEPQHFEFYLIDSQWYYRPQGW